MEASTGLTGTVPLGIWGKDEKGETNRRRKDKD